MITSELIEQIKSLARELPERERELVAQELFAAGEALSGLDTDDHDVAGEFVSELKRRRDSVRDGSAKLIPADVVFAELRALYPER
jgi:hypothetical protein